MPRRTGIPGDCLEGLAQYTHCWLLYIFHENTDLGRLWKGGKEADRGLKAKVAVPRLNGGRMGVLATRSPHRPCPIGAFPTSVALYVALNVVLLWPYRGLKQKGSGFVIVWCMF